MIVMTSAAYVGAEIKNELGLMPPAFLPVGNKRLLELQVHALRHHFTDEIFLTLPFDFQPDTYDLELLGRLNLHVIYVPNGLSLSESLGYALVVAESEDTQIHVLHGDTLIRKLPSLSENYILLGSVSNGYDWELEDSARPGGDEVCVWAGFFSFGCKGTLLRHLMLNSGDFVQAVRDYDADLKMDFCKADEWLDFGHINTYFHSRSLITTERAFNSLSIENGCVKKSGSMRENIEAEARWFKSLPNELKVFTPQLIEVDLSENSHSYTIEYLNLLPLNELYVYGRLPLRTWRNIFSLIKKFLAEASSCYEARYLQDQEVEIDSQQIFCDKTTRRLAQYTEQTGFDIDAPIEVGELSSICYRDIVELATSILMKQSVIASVIHGDLCFSNILYDSRANRVKLIDPRGMNDAGEFKLIGDQRYDIAKLAHSTLGKYDHIIAGHYKIIGTGRNQRIEIFCDDRHREIDELFLDEFTSSNNLPSLVAAVILLFFSMLPLHNDRPDRQRAMVLNTIRLYSEYLKPCDESLA